MLFGAAALVSALWLAWSIVANTAADNLARSDPEAALEWQATNAAALVALAGEGVTATAPPGDAAEVRALAERALAATPLEIRPLAVLALLAERDGRRADASRLMALAAARSRRDGYVQIWSFYDAARQADFATAVAHADALLRTRGHLRSEIAPTLIAFSVDPEANAAVVAALADDPPWRGWYLGELARQTDDPGIAYAIYADLGKTANPPTDAELFAYLDQLVRVGRFEQAYLTWIAFLPEERRQAITYAYNGDFEYPPSGLPFDWTIGRITGAATGIVETGDDDIGHAVRIEFANRRVPYRHLRKLLMLPPGVYRLSGRARAQDLDNDRGLVWQIACAEGDKQLLGETEAVRGTADWHGVSATFDVPHTGCRAQWLTLVLPAKAELEQQIGGVVWFDDFQVSRDTEAATAAN